MAFHQARRRLISFARVPSLASSISHSVSRIAELFLYICQLLCATLFSPRPHRVLLNLFTFDANCIIVFHAEYSVFNNQAFFENFAFHHNRALTINLD